MQIYMEKIKQAPLLDLEIDLDRHKFDIRILFAEFCSWYTEMLAAKDLQLTTDISGVMPRYFCGNQILVRRLFFEIGKISLLYIGRGSAFITFRAEQLTGRRYTIVFTITVIGGNGIPPSREQGLFQPFNTRSDQDGFSLRSTNLYYARMIAQIYGGDIQVENMLEVGTKYQAILHPLMIPD